ncbi:MAG TPA: hypothetical protein DEG63_07075, partial [Flavobacteriaceae bacterium]|nr:hypothetical protein [Flavobacteriaceae bacterium]
MLIYFDNKWVMLIQLIKLSVLDKIIKFSIQNKIVIGIMTVLWIIWGVWSATKLPIDAVPDI